MAYGIQGNCRYTHVPAMLEMAGVPYTGSSPLGHALALDKVITKRLLREAGIPTPNYRVLRGPEDSAEGLHFPVVVKPRHESTSFGLQLITEPAAVGAAVEAIVANYQQEALVEEYVAGREVCVALLGNDRGIEIFPMVEHDFGDRLVQLVTCDDKMHKVSTEPGKICPASLPEALAAQLRDIALATFRTCHCQDYARVDIRLDAEMNPFVLEINSMASLGPTGSYVLAAQTAGYSFDGLIGRILDVAHRRYFTRPMPVARIANADEFIQRLPHRYDTVVAERATTLSGGQKQRTAIARAVLRDAPIVILDEPTTGLDAASERLVLEALERVVAGRTALIIAHRLATVRLADRIVVLERGRIIEHGTHAELLVRNGAYARLYRLQTSLDPETTLAAVAPPAREDQVVEGSNRRVR